MNELMKVVVEMRDRHKGFPVSDERVKEWATRIEAIAKAQGEPVAWFRIEQYSRPGETGTRQRIAFGKDIPPGDGWRALCFCAAPPSPAVTGLVEALESIVNGTGGILTAETALSSYRSTNGQ